MPNGDVLFQDNHMDPYSEEASVITLLTLARDWIKKAAQRNQEEQSAMALAKEEAKRTGEVRPELSKMDYDLLLKEFKSENPRTRDDAWIAKFKKAFENMRIRKREEKGARDELVRQRGEKRQSRLMKELLTPWPNSCSAKKEELEDDTPPRRGIWRCYKCDKEA